MPIPARLLLYLLAGWLVLAGAVPLWPALLLVWQGAALLIGGAVCADLLMAALLHWRSCPIEVSRSTPAAWPVGAEETVTLHLRNLEGGAGQNAALVARNFSGQIFDHYPEHFAAQGMPASFTLPAGRSLQLSYQATATARGDHRFGKIELRVATPLGLFAWSHRVGSEETVRVYPDFARVVQYSLLATDNRLSQLGVLRKRRRGGGMEFHQLREFRDGDSPRQVDWKATARQGKLIARDYQDERNQQIVFLLDCGLRMHTREQLEQMLDLAGAQTAAGSNNARLSLSHFDHTLNAMLLLAYVALHQGDGIGLSTFAHPEPRHFAPRKSQAALKLLLNVVYDLEPTLAVPDFVAAAEGLSQRLQKRSLVVVLTNLREEDHADLLPALAILRRKHLIVLASLREPGLSSMLSAPIGEFDDALAHAAAVEYMQTRQRFLSTLRKSGIHCLDVAPQELHIALVNAYWGMKRAGIF